MKDRRYTVVLDAYLYAKDDDDAKTKAAKVAEFLQTLDDNHAQVVELVETPFGFKNYRPIYKRGSKAL